jgi:nucleoside-diphosphate-sugar epimerase
MGSAKKILLFGGTGLVGRALMPKLLSEGHEVFVVTRNGAALPPGAQAIKADISHPQWLEACRGLQNIDLVIYAAYSTGTDAQYDRRVNVEALKEAVSALKPLQVIYLSTIGVFAGDAPEGTFDETSCREAATPYERDKLDAEIFLQQCAHCQVTVFNLSIVYDRDSPRIREYKRLLGLGYLLYKNKGEGTYNIVHADDVAEAILLAMRREQKPGYASYIVNAQCLEFCEWIALLERYFGYDKKTKLPRALAPLLRGPLRTITAALGLRAPMRLSEPKATILEKKHAFSSEKIRRELGWVPRQKAADVLLSASNVVRRD